MLVILSAYILCGKQVYFNNNSKIFMPIFTITLTARTLPCEPELLPQASLRPDQLRRQAPCMSRTAG
jgi:hypothetical protein